MVLQRDRQWTRRSLLNEAVHRLEAAGLDDARRNAEWMLEEVLQCGRALLYAYPEAEVGPAQVRAYAQKLVRRLRHEPVQYILGYADFFGLRLQVTPAVLIPRPETEQVVEAALALIEPVPAPRVLDIGTGSGCIALALKHARPEAIVAACDVSAAALAIAARNAAAHGLGISFTVADVRRPRFPAQFEGGLHLVISNPPYVPLAEAETLAAEVRDHEPALALFAGDDPLYFYRLIARHAAALLAPGGWLVFETHADYAGAVGAVVAEAGFDTVRLQPDLAGLPRIVSARYLGQGG